MKRYYVIAYKSGEADIAVDNLKQQGFTAYHPLMGVTKMKKGLPEPAVVPLFAGYMFVKFDIERDRWKRIANTKGVYQLLTATDERCTALPVGFVEALRKLEIKKIIPESAIRLSLIPCKQLEQSSLVAMLCKQLEAKWCGE